MLSSLRIFPATVFVVWLLPFAAEAQVYDPDGGNPQVNFSSSTVDEGGMVELQVRMSTTPIGLTIRGGTIEALVTRFVAAFSTSGTLSGNEHTAISTCNIITFSFTPPIYGCNIPIQISTDSVYEHNETLTVSLIFFRLFDLSGHLIRDYAQNTDAQGMRVPYDQTTVTITNATPLAISVFGPEGTFREGNNLTFFVRGNVGPGVSIPGADAITGIVTFSGHAPQNSQSSFSISSTVPDVSYRITVFDDNLNEGPTTVTAALSNVQRAGIGAGSVSIPIAASDPIAVTIVRQGSANVNENGSVTFRVFLSGGLRTADVVVPFSFSGALGNGEYAITAPAGIAATATGGTVTFDTSGTPTPTDTADITVNLQGDTLNEATEALTVTGAAAGSTGLRTAGAIDYTTVGNTASANITDDDAITVTAAPAESSVAEGGEAEFTVTLSTTSAADATVVFSAAIVAQTMTANADGNPDFALDTPSASPLMIDAGKTESTITVDINDDRLAEDAETLRLTVSGVTLGAAGGMVSTTFPVTSDVTIAQNTAAVYGVDFAATAPTTIAEGTATATAFTVELTGAREFTGNIEVTWGFTAGETVAADFSGGTSPAGGTLTFTHADRSETISITTAQDVLSEGGGDGDETFSLTLSAASSLDDARLTALGGVQLGGDHDVAITDDDDLSVAIARKVGDTGALGEDGGSAAFTVTLSGATSTADVTVDVAVSIDSAGAGDYSAPASLTISSGESSGEITVTGVADTLLEGDETFSVTISNPGGGGGATPTITTATSPSVTITDAESATVAIARSDNDGFTEGEAGVAGNAVFTVTISGGELTENAMVTFTVAGGTPPGAGVTDHDYTVDPAASSGVYTLTVGPGAADDDDDNAETATAKITVTQVDDDLNEAAETVTVTLTNASGSGLSSASGSATAPLSDDDDITVAIARVGNSPVAEDVGTVNFTVTLGGGIRTTAITMPFSVGGTGITAGDYDISGPGTAPAATATGHTVTFPAPSDSVTPTASDSMMITIAITDDDVNEAMETLTVTGAATSSTGLRVATGGGDIDYATDGDSASVVISQNDDITVTIARTTPASGNVDEGGAVTFTVTLSVESQGSVEVPWSAAINTQTNTGNANTVANPDLTAGSATPTNAGGTVGGALTIAAGDTEGTFTVTVAADSLVEGEETFRASIAAPTAGSG
ncbi:MAG: hypothetical protein OXU31_09675, partial [Gammaproteobacteria bacterium]|nr:hypothetical protein [Gammaproteobacteria bacterium]